MDNKKKMTISEMLTAGCVGVIAITLLLILTVVLGGVASFILSSMGSLWAILVSLAVIGLIYKAYFNDILEWSRSKINTKSVSRVEESAQPEE